MVALSEHRLDLDDVVEKALEQDREVVLTRAERYGFHVVIDGVPVTEQSGDCDDGLPWEGLTYPIDDSRLNPSERAIEKSEEVAGVEQTSEGEDDEK